MQTANCRLKTEDCGLLTEKAILTEIKGDKMPASIHIKMNSFTNHCIKLCKGDIVYLMTDGYADQFGGKNGRKFMAKNLKEILVEICTEPMHIQKEILNDKIDNWRNNYEVKFEQTDDITIMGIKIV